MKKIFIKFFYGLKSGFWEIFCLLAVCYYVFTCKIKKCLTVETVHILQLEMSDLPTFGIFHRSKKEEEQKMQEKAESTPTTMPEPAAPAVCETKDADEKVYLRAMPLRDMSDLESIKAEVTNGNILILRITPLANKSVEDVKNAVNELYAFTETIGGDIARLGEERIVICPQKIRIWREKTPVQSESLPTAA